MCRSEARKHFKNFSFGTLRIDSSTYLGGQMAEAGVKGIPDGASVVIPRLFATTLRLRSISAGTRLAP